MIDVVGSNSERRTEWHLLASCGRRGFGSSHQSDWRACNAGQLVHVLAETVRGCL